MPYTTRIINDPTGELVCSLPIRVGRASDYAPIRPIGGDTLCVSYHYFPALTFLTPEFSAQYLHLATYTRGDGAVVFDDGKPFTPEDVSRILRLDKQDTREFWKAAEHAHRRPVYIDGGCVYLNRAYAYRPYYEIGETDRDFCLSSASLRTLFESVDRFSYELLHNFFLLLPHINRDWNSFCYNPDETNPNLILPLHMNLFHNWLKPSATNSFIADDVIGAYETCCFDHKKKTYRIFEVFIEPDSSYEICVNPFLVYSGCRKYAAIKRFFARMKYAVPSVSDDLCEQLAFVGRTPAVPPSGDSQE